MSWLFVDTSEASYILPFTLPGGRGGIRTHGTVAGTTVFKTVSIDHSDTLPYTRNRGDYSSCPHKILGLGKDRRRHAQRAVVT
jgi:hypothetical protein